MVHKPVCKGAIAEFLPTLTPAAKNAEIIMPLATIAGLLLVSDSGI